MDNARKKTEWVAEVTEDLRNKLLASSVAAYESACSLLSDAKILQGAGRYARAGALAILAEEEFAKSFVVCICAGERRWDSEVLVGLRDHGRKQAISQAMLDYWKWVQENMAAVEKMNRFSLTKTTPSVMLSPGDMDALLRRVEKEHVKKRTRDVLKQRMFYVAIGQSGSVIHDPKSITESMAAQCLEATTAFKTISEIALGHHVKDFKPIVA
jgi:AbiV family abortive infection protein